MERKCLQIVLFSGLCFLPACSPGKYILVEIAKTWTEAQTCCRKNYHDLAKVENAEEMEEVVKVSMPYHSGHVWIGLHHEEVSWKWSLEKEGYYGAGETDFRMWSEHEPNDLTQGSENCVFMRDNGRWFDTRCTTRLPFVCLTGSSASPRFISVDGPMNWWEARSYCRERYTDLASVRNLKESEQIEGLTLNNPTWIGLYREPWKWSDGTPVSFRKWSAESNEPNEGVSGPCVLVHEAHWKDRTCGRDLFFVCQIEVPVQKLVVRLKLTTEDSTGNLEGAAQDILQQLTVRHPGVNVPKDVFTDSFSSILVCSCTSLGVETTPAGGQQNFGVTG